MKFKIELPTKYLSKMGYVFPDGVEWSDVMSGQCDSYSAAVAHLAQEEAIHCVKGRITPVFDFPTESETGGLALEVMKAAEQIAKSSADDREVFALAWLQATGVPVTECVMREEVVATEGGMVRRVTIRKKEE